MKKLSLKNLKLEGNDKLQRNQLKSVFGGYGEDGPCQVICNNGSQVVGYLQLYHCPISVAEGIGICEQFGPITHFACTGDPNFCLA